MISNAELILRLLLSMVVGGLIGIERESSNKPAGFRTHILVSLGAALVTLISTQGFGFANSIEDPARLASQIVSGIGFLGAGTIVMVGNNIKGLTTAASLWVCGGIGLSIGAGFYLGGLTASIIAFISLGSLSRIQNRSFNNRHKVVSLYCSERAKLLTDLGLVFEKNNISIKNILIDKCKRQYSYLLATAINEADLEHETVELEFTLLANEDFNYEDLENQILDVEGVEIIKWEN